jgi:hypothetical protein
MSGHLEQPGGGYIDTMHSRCLVLIWEGKECKERTLTMWDLSEANSRMNTSPGTILNKLRIRARPY